MILGTLDRLVDIFRTKKEIEYRKILGQSIKGRLKLDDEIFEFDNSQKNIRKDYYDIFRSIVNSDTLRYSIDPSNLDKTQPKVSFYGDDHTLGVKLEYTRDKSLLNINFKPGNVYSHGIKGNGYNNYINVITFYTSPEKNVDNKISMITRIIPGEYVDESVHTPHSPPVDEIMPQIFDRVMNSRYIPVPCEEEIVKFPDYKVHLLNEVKKDEDLSFL